MEGQRKQQQIIKAQTNEKQQKSQPKTNSTLKADPPYNISDSKVTNALDKHISQYQSFFKDISSFMTEQEMLQILEGQKQKRQIRYLKSSTLSDPTMSMEFVKYNENKTDFLLKVKIADFTVKLRVKVAESFLDTSSQNPIQFEKGSYGICYLTHINTSYLDSKDAKLSKSPGKQVKRHNELEKANEKKVEKDNEMKVEKEEVGERRKGDKEKEKENEGIPQAIMKQIIFKNIRDEMRLMLERYESYQSSLVQLKKQLHKNQSEIRQIKDNMNQLKKCRFNIIHSQMFDCFREIALFKIASVLSLAPPMHQFYGIYDVIITDQWMGFVMKKGLKVTGVGNHQQLSYKIKSKLKFMHQILHLSHRDIKPANLILSDDRKDIYFIDFGKSQFINSSIDYRHSIQTTFAGTKGYISKEALSMLQSKNPMKQFNVFFEDVFALKLSVVDLSNWVDKSEAYSYRKVDESLRNLLLRQQIIAYIEEEKYKSLIGLIKAFTSEGSSKEESIGSWSKTPQIEQLILQQCLAKESLQCDRFYQTDYVNLYPPQDRNSMKKYYEHKKKTFIKKSQLIYFYIQHPSTSKDVNKQNKTQKIHNFKHQENLKLFFEIPFLEVIEKLWFYEISLHNTIQLLDLKDYDYFMTKDKQQFHEEINAFEITILMQLLDIKKSHLSYEKKIGLSKKIMKSLTKRQSATKNVQILKDAIQTILELSLKNCKQFQQIFHTINLLGSFILLRQQYFSKKQWTYYLDQLLRNSRITFCQFVLVLFKYRFLVHYEDQKIVTINRINSDMIVARIVYRKWKQQIAKYRQMNKAIQEETNSGIEDLSLLAKIRCSSQQQSTSNKQNTSSKQKCLSSQQKEEELIENDMKMDDFARFQVKVEEILSLRLNSTEQQSKWLAVKKLIDSNFYVVILGEEALHEVRLYFYAEIWRSISYSFLESKQQCQKYLNHFNHDQFSQLHLTYSKLFLYQDVREFSSFIDRIDKIINAQDISQTVMVLQRFCLAFKSMDERLMLENLEKYNLILRNEQILLNANHNQLFSISKIIREMYLPLITSGIYYTSSRSQHSLEKIQIADVGKYNLLKAFIKFSYDLVVFFEKLTSMFSKTNEKLKDGNYLAKLINQNYITLEDHDFMRQGTTIEEYQQDSFLMYDTVIFARLGILNYMHYILDSLKCLDYVKEEHYFRDFDDLFNKILFVEISQQEQVFCIESHLIMNAKLKYAYMNKYPQYQNTIRPPGFDLDQLQVGDYQVYELTFLEHFKNYQTYFISRDIALIRVYQRVINIQTIKKNAVDKQKQLKSFRRCLKVLKKLLVSQDQVHYRLKFCLMEELEQYSKQDLAYSNQNKYIFHSRQLFKILFYQFLQQNIDHCIHFLSNYFTHIELRKDDPWGFELTYHRLFSELIQNKNKRFLTLLGLIPRYLDYLFQKRRHLNNIHVQIFSVVIFLNQKELELTDEMANQLQRSIIFYIQESIDQNLHLRKGLQKAYLLAKRSICMERCANSTDLQQIQRYSHDEKEYLLKYLHLETNTKKVRDLFLITDEKLKSESIGTILAQMLFNLNPKKVHEDRLWHKLKQLFDIKFQNKDQ